MFPLKDDNPSSSVPFVTVALIAANVLVFIYQFFIVEPGLQEAIVYKFAFIPFELTHGTELTPQAPFPTLATVFTSMFMHGGIMHLVGNMLYLWIFGNNIEDLLGPIGFFVFYILSGVGAVALFVVFGPNSQVPMVGASGAISGVLGMYALKFPHARVLTLIFLGWFIRMIWIPALAVLGIWFVMQLIFALMSTAAESGGGGVAYMAHVGGFLVGLIGALFIRRPTTSY